LKFSILNNQDNLVTSELASNCFKRIKAKFIENYNRSEQQEQNLFSNMIGKNELSQSKEKNKTFPN